MPVAGQQFEVGREGGDFLFQLVYQNRHAAQRRLPGACFELAGEAGCRIGMEGGENALQAVRGMFDQVGIVVGDAAAQAFDVALPGVEEDFGNDLDHFAIGLTECNTVVKGRRQIKRRFLRSAIGLQLFQQFLDLDRL